MLTELVQRALIPLTAGDSVAVGLGLSVSSLKSHEPSVALGSINSLKCMLVAMILESKFGGSSLGHIFDIGLLMKRKGSAIRSCHPLQGRKLTRLMIPCG